MSSPAEGRVPEEVRRFSPEIRVMPLGRLAAAGMCEDTEGPYIHVDDLPAIRKDLLAEQEKEVERCDNCDGSGIYEEGDEWAPCAECELGRDFAEYLKAALAEQLREVRERLLSEELRQAIRDAVEDGCGFMQLDIDIVDGISEGAFEAVAAALTQQEGQEVEEPCRFWLARLEGNVVHLEDGCHDGPEGVAKAAKLVSGDLPDHSEDEEGRDG